MLDIAAIVLAFLAIACRWQDHPKAAALCGYSSALCSFVASRRARQHAHVDAD
jgi:hypothetical protein